MKARQMHLMSPSIDHSFVDRKCKRRSSIFNERIALYRRMDRRADGLTGRGMDEQKDEHANGQTDRQMLYPPHTVKILKAGRQHLQN